MSRPIRNLRRAFAVLVAVLVIGARPVRADVVLQWDDIAVTTMITTAGVSPFAQARFAAIVQLAVFEAVNAITGEYEGYLGSPAAPTAVPIVAPFGASPEAASIAAAHAVLLNYFSGSSVALDNARNTSLAAIPDGLPKTNGVAVGLAAAAALIAERGGDGSDPLTFFLPDYPLSPGEWDITPGCPLDPSGNPRGGQFLNWQGVRPFGVAESPGLDWTEAFRPKAPPSLTSNQYAKDYNEVNAVGDVNAPGSERPADRATVARFYAFLSPAFLFHAAARQLAEARGDSLTENARNLALISIATSDSLVASFAAKYRYNFWRPVTAIRAGAADDNDKTTAKVDFTPLHWHSLLPELSVQPYASGSNGAAETMRRIYGAAGHSITLSSTIPVIGPVTLVYTSLRQICDDIDDARVYGGIHFRFDQEAGVRLGRDVATHIYKNSLKPVHPAP